jgi:hypothetical protein
VKFFRRFLAYAVLVPVMQFLMGLFHIPEILGEHAIVSWVDDKIAEKLGIAGPTLDQLVAVTVNWGPSAALAFLCLSGWLVALHLFSAVPAIPDKIEPQQKAPTATLHNAEPVAKEERKPLTMRQTFDSDFPGMGKTFMDLHMELAGREAKFSVTEFWNIPANSYFLALYPHGEESAFDTIAGVAGAIPLVIKELGKVYFEVITPGDTKIVTNDTMIFSGQIYCYLEQDMPLQQLSQLETIYLSHRYRLTFRGSAYHALHWKEYERWPVGTGPDGNSGAQLPEAVPGVRVRIHNRIDNKPSQGVVPTITSPQFGSAPDRAG